MERGVSGKITKQKSLETTKDVPTELMHRIQSLLSEKEAGRTCVLSKSWLHAWSTFPFLRFPFNHKLTPTSYNELIYNTIKRYHNNNIPIQAFKFYFKVENPELDEIWMGCILSSETTSFLKELSLDIRGEKETVFTFSDDTLFSGENLHTITIEVTKNRFTNTTVNVGMNPVIKCVSLRVLELSRVNISDDIFHNLVSTCSLLEKVVLSYCTGLKTIKVKNLSCLCHLEITSCEEEGLLEIDNVPNLGYFCYVPYIGFWDEPFKTTDATASCLGRSVTHLHLEGVIIDDTFFEMIKSKFLFLESLNLQVKDWVSERLIINSLSLRRLELWLGRGLRPIPLQVDAPNLVYFSYSGRRGLPTLLFPTTIAPKKIELFLELDDPLNTSFLLKLRELLTLSSKFYIHIQLFNKSRLKTHKVDDLRKRVVFPVTNVQQLYFTCKTTLDDQFKEHKRVLNAFFSICHPVEVRILNYNKCFSKLLVSWLMKNNTKALKDVLMKNCLTGIWESLTSSREIDLLDKMAGEFKLNWFSHD